MIVAPRQRFIFECDPEHFILAGRAARWLIERPQHKDSILAYGEGAKEVAFYAKRTKSGLSVRQMKSCPTGEPES